MGGLEGCAPTLIKSMLGAEISGRAVRERHRDLLGTAEAGFAGQPVQPRGARQALLVGGAKAVYHRLLPRPDPRQIGPYVADIYTILRRSPRLVRYSRARSHRLGRGAAFVDTAAADVLALDQRYLPTRLGQCQREWRTGLPAAYNQCIISRHLFLR